MNLLDLQPPSFIDLAFMGKFPSDSFVLKYSVRLMFGLSPFD
jgi:hypothetical protein